MQLCVGTSMAIIIPTTIRSYLTHRAKGMVLNDVMRAWALPAVLGVAVGSVIAYFAPSAVFKIVFMVTVTIIAIKLLFGRDNWKIADDFPGRPAMIGYGFLIGITSSLMGVSGGSVSNMVQTLYGKSLHNAVATSAGLGVPITIAGTIGLALAGWPQMALLPPFSIGYVSLLGVVIMAPVSSFTASYGRCWRTDCRNAGWRSPSACFCCWFRRASSPVWSDKVSALYPLGSFVLVD